MMWCNPKRDFVHCASIISIVFFSSSWAADKQELTPCQASPLEIVSFWKFDEGAGPTTRDSVGNNDGAIFGPGWSTGKVGNALQFDGGDDYVQLPNAVTPRGAFTIEAFINLATIAGHQYIYSDWGIGFLVLETGYLNLNWWTDQFGSVVVDSQVRLTTDQWHHVVATYDVNHLRLFVDGELASLAVNPTGSLDTPDSISESIGKAYNDRFYFHGKIDQLTIYERALTAEEIQEHFRSGWQSYPEAALSGLFYDPSNSGHGFDFNMLDVGLIAYYYGHTSNGERLWMISNPMTEAITFGTPFVLEMFEIESGVFGAPEGPVNPWGSIIITMSDFDSGRASFDGQDGSLEMDFVRLASLSGMNCAQ